jgi:hypothetical protein
LCRAGQLERKPSLTRGTRPHVPLGYPFHSPHHPPVPEIYSSASSPSRVAPHPRHVLLCTCKRCRARRGLDTTDHSPGLCVCPRARNGARIGRRSSPAAAAGWEAVREPTGAHVAAGGADWTCRWTQRSPCCMAVRNGRRAGNISTVAAHSLLRVVREPISIA